MTTLFPQQTDADAWAVNAAALPLAFAQVREDPRLDLEVLRLLGTAASVVMVASGGDTAVCLGGRPLESLVLVDMNAAQLALTRLKWHLAQTQTPGQRLALLGHAPMQPAERHHHLRLLFDELGLDQNVCGPPDQVALHGPDYMGRYEWLFSQLQRELAPQREDLLLLLQTAETEKAGITMDPSFPLGQALDAALARVMSLPNLVRLFGQEATQNPRQEFHRHFAQRIRQGFAMPQAEQNPFLWQLLGGEFPPGIGYDWLQSDSAVTSVEPVYRHGRMKQVLDGLPEASADFVHLSNILDWLTASEAAACLRSAARVLRPGGVVLVRQLNSTLAMEELSCGVTWDRELGRHLHARDRSFFYAGIHAGRKS